MQLAFDQVSFTYDASLARTEKKQAKKAAKQRSAVSNARTEAAISPNDAATEAASLAASAGVANADEAASATHVAGTTPSPTAYADWGNNPDNQWALQNISFTVNEGDFLGIAGHTGSGKSTLLQHMNGLLEPTRGRITLDGADLADKAARKSCRNAVGVVFQYPERQLFASTVYDDVAFGPRNLKLGDIEVDRRVRASLESVGLSCDDLGNASPFELSGGQQRRVAFAGVLAMNPQVLVLDEPTAGLDPEAKAMFLQLIDTLHKDGMTVVMVSHNMDDLARFCNRIIVLNQGQIVLEGTPEQVFSHEGELHAIGLDIPTAQRMANNLRAHGVRLPARLFFDAQDLANACAALYKQGLQADKAQNMQGAASQNATEATKAPDSGAQPSAQATSQPSAQISATQQEELQS